MPPHTPAVEYKKALLVQNNVNLRGDTLKILADDHNPGKFLITFMFDAAVAGSITAVFLAKEGENCNLIPLYGDVFKPVMIDFEKGLKQKFQQPPGTGIDLSAVEEELIKSSEMDVYPLAIKIEALLDSQTGARNSQITYATIGYQIGNSMEHDLDGNNGRKECVICLSEPCNTTVFPCRHQCMCNGCAEILRFQTDRYPVCRQPIDLLLGN